MAQSHLQKGVSALEDTMKFAAHVLASLSLGSEHGSRSEAIVVFPGKHQLWRVETGIRVWSTRGASRLWIAATAGDPLYTRQDILDLIKKVAGANHRYLDGDVECGGFANITPDQAKWVLELLKANPEVTNLVMVTALYHLPRTILTCLKQMILQERFARIQALPVMQGPKFDDPDGLVEIRKIPEYQAKGDIATHKEWERCLPRIQGLHRPTAQ